MLHQAFWPSTRHHQRSSSTMNVMKVSPCVNGGSQTIIRLHLYVLHPWCFEMSQVSLPLGRRRQNTTLHSFSEAVEAIHRTHRGIPPPGISTRLQDGPRSNCLHLLQLNRSNKSLRIPGEGCICTTAPPFDFNRSHLR